MIYLDNAATSFPKPYGMAEYMADIIKHSAANFGRGGYKSAIKNSEEIFSVRMAVAAFFGSDNPDRFIFTKNATEALNTAIFGTLEKGDTVITTPLEHNSVMRPLNMLGCNIMTLPLNEDGSADISAIGNFKLPKLVIINHASNVSGVINDIKSAADYCREMNIPCLIDASQSAGHIPISADLNAMIACAGHKGLLGPQGTGILYVPPNYNIRPLTAGGTGNSSELMLQPSELPDRFESGTLNSPGIMALGYSIDYINKKGADKIHSREIRLTNILIDELKKIKNIHILFPENKNRTPLVSFYSDNIDVVEFAGILDRRFSISVRSGLHCAPAAHLAYGTLETGTVRVSPGAFTKLIEIEKFIYAVGKITKSL